MVAKVLRSSPRDNHESSRLDASKAFQQGKIQALTVRYARKTAKEAGVSFLSAKSVTVGAPYRAQRAPRPNLPRRNQARGKASINGDQDSGNRPLRESAAETDHSPPSRHGPGLFCREGAVRNPGHERRGGLFN